MNTLCSLKESNKGGKKYTLKNITFKCPLYKFKVCVWKEIRHKLIEY